MLCLYPPIVNLIDTSTPMIPSLPEKPVGALMNGLAILRYLADVCDPVGVTKVAKDLGLNPSTCFNLLKTLVHESLVNFDETAKTYTIGLGIVELAKGALERNTDIRMIRPHLQEIADRFGVTATLWQRVKGERVVLLDLAQSDSTIRVHMSIGQRLPMYVAAMGRCFIAASEMTREEIKQKFLSIRWESRPSFDTYLKEIQQARKVGYASDAGCHVKGVTTVSSVLPNDQQQPTLALSAVGFSAQLDSSATENLGLFIKSTIDRLEQR